MANLLETIRRGQAGLRAPGMDDQTARVQQLLRAKSGKAVSAPEAGTSALGEQQGVLAGQQQMQQVQGQAQIASQAQQQDLAGLEQRESLQGQEIEQARRFDTIESRLKTDQLLNELERGKGQIDVQREEAMKNQIAATLRLQTKQYTDNLQREGARARLDNEIGFKQALQRASFEDNENLLKKELGNKEILDATAREYRIALEQMDLNTAWEFFRNQTRADNRRKQWQAITGGATTILGGASKYQAGSGSGGTSSASQEAPISSPTSQPSSNSGYSYESYSSNPTYGSERG